MGSVRNLLTYLNGGDARADYYLLPSGPSTSSGNFRRRLWRSKFWALWRVFTVRRIFIILALTPSLLICVLLWSGIPPNYQDVRTFEDMLPQHNLGKAQERGERYIRFPGHLWGHGFNNVIQETLLMAYVAHASNRSFVFEDYVWSKSISPYTVYDFALRPARIPLNAFISGPAAGGPMPGPLAISSKFWESVCPEEKRRVISSRDEPNWSEGSVIIDWWVNKLKGVQDACVEIDSSEKVIFDMYLFGNTRILSLMSDLMASPILAHFNWSPLVRSAVLRNTALLQPPQLDTLYDLSDKSTVPGLVAVHIRRGDYTKHCPHLEYWDAPYMGLNQHPSLPDKFDPSQYPHDDPRHAEMYRVHCLPSVAQIVDRLRALRVEHPQLRHVYVLTNAWAGWMGDLRNALCGDGWDGVQSTLDIVLDEEQKYVSMAVDMAIAEKAEVLLGNGFSSLTANLVMLRMAKGLDISSNRFL